LMGEMRMLRSPVVQKPLNQLLLHKKLVQQKMLLYSYLFYSFHYLNKLICLIKRLTYFVTLNPFLLDACSSNRGISARLATS
jgi:hypothetical protein